MQYIIRFFGCPAGRLNTAAKEWYAKVVEAEDEEAAALKAYDTHDHLIPSMTSVHQAVPADELTDTELRAADEAHMLFVTEKRMSYVPLKWLNDWRKRVAKETHG